MDVVHYFLQSWETVKNKIKWIELQRIDSQLYSCRKQVRNTCYKDTKSCLRRNLCSHILIVLSIIFIRKWHQFSRYPNVILDFSLSSTLPHSKPWRLTSKLNSNFFSNFYYHPTYTPVSSHHHISLSQLQRTLTIILASTLTSTRISFLYSHHIDLSKV